jgi:putative peptidoglycan lipid II flippase
MSFDPSRGFYALGSTWLPTIVGTIIAFLSVPLYVVLRQQWGTIGLAIASSTTILVYVLLLGWLQYRRFDQEAATKGTTLQNVPGMLDAALRLVAAAGIAIGVGLGMRVLLVQFLPGMNLGEVLTRATVLCVVGVGIYLALARLLGIRELAQLERILLPGLDRGAKADDAAGQLGKGSVRRISPRPWGLDVAASTGRYKLQASRRRKSRDWWRGPASW